jgi:hypothetical protein
MARHCARNRGAEPSICEVNRSSRESLMIYGLRCYEIYSINILCEDSLCEDSGCVLGFQDMVELDGQD